MLHLDRCDMCSKRHLVDRGAADLARTANENAVRFRGTRGYSGTAETWAGPWAKSQLARPSALRAWDSPLFSSGCHIAGAATTLA